MTSFNSTLSPLVCKVIAGHILLVLLFISSYQIAFRDLACFLFVHPQELLNGRGTEQDFKHKDLILQAWRLKKKITETQGREEDTKDKIRLLKL